MGESELLLMANGLTSRGKRRHPVTVQLAGTPVSDGSGGYTIPYTNATPATVWASIETFQGEQELVAGNVERASVTHTIVTDYHPQLTRTSRLIFNGRYFYVRGLINVGEVGKDYQLFCEERA